MISIFTSKLVSIYLTPKETPKTDQVNIILVFLNSKKTFEVYSMLINLRIGHKDTIIHEVLDELELLKLKKMLLEESPFEYWEETDLEISKEKELSDFLSSYFPLYKRKIDTLLGIKSSNNFLKGGQNVSD